MRFNSIPPEQICQWKHSRVTLRVGQNGAEELTPPGQAILARGMETLTVISPYLPDDERAQRLNALRLGEIELSDA